MGSLVMSHIEDFKHAMLSHSISDIPNMIIADGQIHRFGHKKNSWYVLHQGTISGGAFGDWKKEINQTWYSKQPNQFNPEERKAWIKEQAIITAKLKAEIKAKQAKAAKKAMYLWRIASTDVDLKHPYLVSKGNIFPHGAKQLGKALLIPVYGQDKQLTGCQFIQPNGSKLFLTGTRKKGSYHCLKPPNFEPDHKQTIYIVEGYATGVSVFMAMNSIVFIAFDKGNLNAIAVFVRSKYAQAVIVICGDNDADGGGQRAAHDAASAVNGSVVIPIAVKDFNDLHQLKGLEVVQMTIDAEIKSKKAVPSATDSTAFLNTKTNSQIVTQNTNNSESLKSTIRPVSIAEFIKMDFPPRENLLGNWLPMQGLVMVYAPRGIGKTFFALNVAYAIASGGGFLCWKSPKAHKVLYIDGEMPAQTMQDRLMGVTVSHEKEAQEDALFIITPDLLPHAMPDLSTVEGQEAIEPSLVDVKLIVIDNISTLCRSGRENDSEGWILVQEWALRQRSAGRSVLFVHHAGKGGNQRGTSKREDVLDTVINLKRPVDYSPSDGASFEIHFEKARGFSGEDAEPLFCQLSTDTQDNPLWTYSPLENTTFDKVIDLTNEGLSQTEIAQELNLNKSTVSRHLKNARDKGLINNAVVLKKSVNSANCSRHKNGE